MGAGCAASLALVAFDVHFLRTTLDTFVVPVPPTDLIVLVVAAFFSVKACKRRRFARISSSIDMMEAAAGELLGTRDEAERRGESRALMEGESLGWEAVGVVDLLPIP